MHGSFSERYLVEYDLRVPPWGLVFRQRRVRSKCGPHRSTVDSSAHYVNAVQSKCGSHRSTVDDRAHYSGTDKENVRR